MLWHIAYLDPKSSKQTAKGQLFVQLYIYFMLHVMIIERIIPKPLSIFLPLLDATGGTPHPAW